MRVYQVEKFIKNNLETKRFNFITMPIISTCGVINFFIFLPYIKKNNFLFIIFFVLLSTVVMSYLVISIKENHDELKKKKERKAFLKNLKEHTLKSSNYNCINFLILDSNFVFLEEDFKQAFQNSNINFEKLAFKGKELLS